VEPEFPTIGRELWWAAQTVTTVGSGDAVPEATAGRLVAFVVMLNALGLVSVITGAVTAAMLEAARDRERERADRTPLR
jgi:voltage-gated potassium channel